MNVQCLQVHTMRHGRPQVPRQSFTREPLFRSPPGVSEPSEGAIVRRERWMYLRQTRRDKRNQSPIPSTGNSRGVLGAVPSRRPATGGKSLDGSFGSSMALFGPVGPWRGVSEGCSKHEPGRVLYGSVSVLTVLALDQWSKRRCVSASRAEPHKRVGPLGRAIGGCMTQVVRGRRQCRLVS